MRRFKGIAQRHGQGVVKNVGHALLRRSVSDDHFANAASAAVASYAASYARAASAAAASVSSGPGRPGTIAALNATGYGLCRQISAPKVAVVQWPARTAA